MATRPDTHGGPPRFLAVAALMLLSAAVLLASGCRTLRRPRDATFEPLERRVDAAPGLALVLPVDVRGPINPARPIRALMDDGRSVGAELWWVSVAPDGRPRWLPSPGRWSATPAAADVLPSGAGSWCVRLDVPGDAIGQGVWLGGRRVALNWLADPRLVPPAASPSWPPEPDTARLAAVERWLEPERTNPLRRWRVRLLTRGFAPPGAREAIPLPENTTDENASAPAEPDAFAEPMLESLALQAEARWRAGLTRLHRADADAAERVRRRLVLTASFGAGVVAPVWACEPDELDTLLADLLNPRLAEGEVADRARAWLDDQPAAAAWIIDDAGTRDGLTGRSMATAGVANLSDRRTLAWAETDPPSGPPDLAPVEPGAVARVMVPSAAEGGARPGHVRPTVRLHVGRWSAVRAAESENMPTRPPGFRFEPFSTDWRLGEWSAGASDTLAAPTPAGAGRGDDAAWITSVLLLREPVAPVGPTLSADRWVAHVECRTPDMGRPDPARDDVVRVWIGPFERGGHVLRVSRSGEAVDEGPPGAGRDPARAPIAGVAVTRLGDRWIARVPLPDGAIEPGGVLRIGLERTDARGVHSAWPRPMLPWQFEPGRMALDTSAWDGLGSDRADRGAP